MGAVPKRPTKVAQPEKPEKPARERLEPTAGAGDPDRAAQYRAVNDAALARLGEWVPLAFPQAHQTAGGATWRVSSASLGRDLEEDISFTAHGIVDWGIADQGDAREGKRTPIDVVHEYGGHPGNPRKPDDVTNAAAWLAERLGSSSGRPT